MSDLLGKFEQVEIKNDTRLAEDDKNFCEQQQALYIKVLKHYRKMFVALQALQTEDYEFRISISEENEQKSEGFTYRAYEHEFVKIEKENFSEIIKGVHGRFIRMINDYFRKKYKVTIDGKMFEDYVLLDKPVDPNERTYFGWRRDMTEEEIEKHNEKLNKYKADYSAYLNSIINAELNYNQIIDDVFLSLGGFDFKEKAEQEIKEAAREAVRNRWGDEPQYGIKNKKISFDRLLCSRHCSIFKRYSVNLSEKDWIAMLKALTYYDSGCKQTGIYNGWSSCFVEYSKDERDGIYDTHEVCGNKVKQFKFYKNGKFDVTFDNHSSALEFAREYLGYSA